MASIKFRDLRADEIDVRQAQVTDEGVVLLLYKDARCDMNILDETVGAENWQRDHKELKGNIYCGVSIWDETKKIWTTKWDCGKESFTESEKGESSDSFKRACFNWGIGRELYTSPRIKIKADKLKKFKQDSYGKWKCNDYFYVKHIKCIDKKITELVIFNYSTKEDCFVYGMNNKSGNAEPDEAIITVEQMEWLYKYEDKERLAKGLAYFKVNSIDGLSRVKADKLIKQLSK